VLGVPLVYVIQHLLIPKEPERDPTFGDDETITGKSQYTSHDHKTVTRCLILAEKCNYDLEYDELELQGSFVPTFLTDLKKVWSIFHTLFLTSSM